MFWFGTLTESKKAKEWALVTNRDKRSLLSHRRNQSARHLYRNLADYDEGMDAARWAMEHEQNVSTTTPRILISC